MWKKIKKAAKKAFKAVVATVVQVVNVIKTVLNSVLGLPDFLLTLFGLQLWKKLRLSVVILRDVTGKPVADQTAVNAAIDEAKRIFAAQVRTRVVPADPDFVSITGAPAPASALEVHCGDAGYGELFGDAGEFFWEYKATNGPGFFLGYGAPVTVFIVKEIVGKERGCSYGPLTDYVTVDLEGLGNARVLAHEVGHACNLVHSASRANLMFAGEPGDLLKRLQRALFRNSRHVTFF